MEKIDFKSIQVKVVLWVGISIIVGASFIIGYSAVTRRSRSIEAAERYSVALAQKEAEVITNELNTAMDAARTMADALRAVKEEDIQLSRGQVNGMLKQILVENPDFLGVYTLWEPDQFDALDAEYANQDGHDETGRFIPYWARDGSGNIIMEPLAGYETEGIGDWYLCPKNSGQECIQDPFLYPIQGVDVLMTSLTVPIMVDGQFLGIVGVDLSLDFLQEVADSIDAYQGEAQLALISNNGTLSGVTERPELVGEGADALSAGFGERAQLVKNGEGYVEMGEEHLEIYQPILIGQTDTPWSVNLMIPSQLITAEANATMWKMIGLAGVAAVLALVAVWFIAKQITEPIETIARGAY